MTNVLIGSTATHTWFSEAREPKDTDYFSDQPIESGDVFWHPAIADWWQGAGNVATPDELYTIKVSHMAWDLKNGSWDKHAFDLLFLKDRGANLIPDLYKLLYGVWEIEHGPKKINLNVDVKVFFDDFVKRTYDHDSIHHAVAYYDRPLFERILRDGQTVAVDKSKWDALDYEDQLRMAREEMYATAVERFIIPSGDTYSPRRAYAWSAKKTVTNFSKGWFTLFVLDNWDKLYRPDCDYVERYKQNKNRLISLEDAA